MKFQIRELIIWPRQRAFPPQVITFKPGKLNVITGASRTGKSAIIPIIDYCLASSDCHIPIDTIRDHASWYGVVVQTDAETILFARRVPGGMKASNDFYLLRGQKMSIPPTIEEPSHTLSDVKLLLNNLAATPYFSLGDVDDQNFKARLSFRDLMALTFQSQGIVANQNILFYKTHAHQHRERLRNWFPYILGAEDLNVLRARNRLKALESQLKRLKHEFSELTSISDGWLANMKGHLNVADEYGLLQEAIPEDASPELLLLLAKSVVENVQQQPSPDSRSIQRASEETTSLDKEESDISAAIALIKKRLTDLSKLKNSFVDYGNGVKKRIDRLHLSKWLQSASEQSFDCPVCHSTEHPESAREIDRICTALEEQERRAKQVAEIPTSFDREEELLKKELGELISKNKSLHIRYDRLLARDKDAQQEFFRRKEMFLFLGHLTASLGMFESLSDGGALREQIEALSNEHAHLLTIADRKNAKQRLNIATADLSQRMLKHLKMLDVEAKYQKVAPRFSVEDLSVKVLSEDGNWHLLAEVGSASNWLAFHLSLMCALQEFFLSQSSSVVPSFVVFDQPSQVYFPKVMKHTDQEEPTYEDEDVNAVQDIFMTLAKSVKESGGKWQAIVLDHADDSIYGHLDNVYEVAKWRDGKKLIPEEWYREPGR